MSQESAIRGMAAGKPNRREIVKGLALVGAAGVASSVWTPKAHAQAAPKSGGRLRIGSGDAATTDSLNTSKDGDAFTYVLGGQLYNCLVEIDANNKAMPAIAESWEPEPGAKIWHFKLRKGVEFHNGKTLTVDDVIWTINYHRGPDSKSAARTISRQIVDMKGDGDALIFTLAAGNADFPYALADPHLAMVPKDTADFEKGIGTGGYSLVDFIPGVAAHTKRNPNYWRSGAAHFDEVETKAINDVNARLSALLSGEVDVINRCPPALIDRIRDNPAIDVVSVEGNLHYTLPMLTDHAPFDNNDVRLALKYAIDRELLLKQILHGYGAIGNDHPIAKKNPYFNKSLPQTTFDPDKVKFHLKKAGLETLKLPLSVSAGLFAGALDLAVIYQQSAAKAGITIDVDRVADDTFWGSVWKHNPWTISYWSGRPTADGILSLVYAGDAPSNETAWKDARFDNLLKQGRTETDETKRMEIYGEMQTILNEEGGAVIPLFANHLHAASRKLAHGPVAGDREFDGARIAERWWFA